MTVWAWQGYYATRTEPVLTEAAAAAKPLIEKAFDAGEDYGACHIVLADINIERHHIEWCLGGENSSDRNITPEGEAAMKAMLGLSCRERAMALCAAEGEGWHAWTDEEWARFDVDDGDCPVDFED